MTGCNNTLCTLTLTPTTLTNWQCQTDSERNPPTANHPSPVRHYQRSNLTEPSSSHCRSKDASINTRHKRTIRWNVALHR